MKNSSKTTLAMCLFLFFCVSSSTAFSQQAKKTTDTTKKAKPKPVTIAPKQATIDTPKKSTKIAVVNKAAGDSAILAKYKKSRIFSGSVELTESDNNGIEIKGDTHPTAKQGQGFYVTGIAKNGDLILRMWIWTLDTALNGNLNPLTDSIKVANLLASKTSDTGRRKIGKQLEVISKRQALNFRNYGSTIYAPTTIMSTDDNIRFFTMSKDSVDQLSVEYAKIKKWDVTFGTFTTPFKIRYRKFAFSNNVALGTAVYYQKKFSQDWSWGFVLGISLSSVTLDGASTNVHPDATPALPASNSTATSPLQTSTTRPAFSPSLSFVIAYKTINFTIGSGIDWISKPYDIATPTNPEAGWIYNGKPWIGIGLGISLFGNASSTTATQPAKGQDNTK